MKAFVETLCEHCGIVRVGPDCGCYGDPYDFAVVYERRDSAAVIKALVTKPALPWWLRWLERFVKPFTIAHAKAIIRALKASGLKATWERRKQEKAS